MRGRNFLYRFADDFVMVFEYGEDARRVMKVAHRFAKYHLTIHPETTRLVDFRRRKRVKTNENDPPH